MEKYGKRERACISCPGRLPAASAVSLRDDGARSLAVIYFRGVPLESPSSLLLPPDPLFCSPKLINLDFLFRKFSSVCPCLQFFSSTAPQFSGSLAKTNNKRCYFGIFVLATFMQISFDCPWLVGERRG